MRYWARAFRLNPTNPETVIGTAMARVSLGDRDAALRDLNQSIGRGLFDPAVYWLRGRILRDESRFLPAAADYDAATRLQPEDPALWQEYASVLDKVDASSDRALGSARTTAKQNAAVFASDNADSTTAIPAIARLYITVSDAALAKRLDEVRKELQKDRSLYVPPARVVRDVARKQNVLSYVFEEDADEAGQVAVRLRALGIPVDSVALRDRGKERRRHFDLLLTGNLPPLLR
jgi:tetratricopeptide (TPR) repeat protein